MQLGWAGLLKTVAITATLTSAVWLAAGAWWYRDNIAPAKPRAPSAEQSRAPSSRPAAAAAKRPFVAGRHLVVPVVGVGPEQLVDTFTQSRSGGRLHDAIDIMAPRGTPVIAAAAGRVEKLFVSDRGGNTVYLRLPDGRAIHYYAHLDRYAPGLREGQSLDVGDPVGTVGSTGNASPAGPHLHFAVLEIEPQRKWYDSARAINPYPLLTRR